MALGLCLGLGLHVGLNREAAAFRGAVWILNLLGRDLFVGALKMLVAPLIFASIVSGITSLDAAGKLGAIGLKTLGYYLTTTAIAVAIGMALVLLIQPGARESSRELRRQVARQQGETWQKMQAAKERGPGEMFRQDILAATLSNPVQALAETRSLGIIFFALLLGLGCLAVGEPARPVAAFFQGLNQVMMAITLWVMRGSPLFIGCLLASLVAELGLASLQSLAWYSATVVLGIALHVVLLVGLVRGLGGMSPRTFWRGFRPAWLVAFTTTSSAATLPVTVQCVTEGLGVSDRVARFALPIGATVNMDGTALYEGVAVIFLVQCFGGLAGVPATLGAGALFLVFITAVLASIGAAAVPSAGLVTMTLVASAVGLPVEYIVFIFAVDHVLDMFRTSTNVLGDAVGAVIVDRWTR